MANASNGATVEKTGLAIEILYVIISALGGLAKYLNGYLRGKRFDLWKLLASMLVSAFSGVTCAHLALIIRPGWEIIAASVGGFMGGEAMTFLATWLTKKLNIEEEQSQGDNKDDDSKTS